MAKAPEYHLAKMSDPNSKASEYPYHDRANTVYGQWMAGYTEEEIALFQGLLVTDINADIMYVQTRTPIRSIITHNNDRNRILLQRQQSESFRTLLADTLGKSASDFLAAGISPAGILKEYREATGMVQRAEPLIQVNTQQNFAGNGGGGSGITSAEDVIRKVLDGISQRALPSEEFSIIDLELETSGDDTSPLQDRHEDQTPQVNTQDSGI